MNALLRKQLETVDRRTASTYLVLLPAIPLVVILAPIVLIIIHQTFYWYKISRRFSRV